MPDLRVALLVLLGVLALLALLVFVPVRPEPIPVSVTLTEWSLGFERLEIGTRTTLEILGVTILSQEADAVWVQFVVENRGTMAHGLEVEGTLGGKKVEWEVEPFPPGETRTLKVLLPRGEYELYCPVPGHRERGMEAVLVVR